MDYLAVTSLLIGLCFVASTIFFSVSVVKRKGHWIGILSRMGVAASIAGGVLYIFNLLGIWKTPIDPSIARPIIFFLALFVLVVSYTFYQRSAGN